jgi:type III pantothenate kinase
MLVIDVGNTQAVLGYFKEETLLGSFRIDTDPNRTSDQYKLLIRGFLSQINSRWEDFDTITLASVVSRVSETISRLKNEKRIVQVSHRSPLSFSIKIPEPETLGADRIANVEGAISKYEAPFIIVDLGTAITFDVVNSKKEYIGGAITPGIYTSADALFNNASKLFSTTLEAPSKVIGNNTKKSLQSGIVHGFASLIDGMIGKMKKEIGEKNVTVIGTGGQLEIISPLTSSIDKTDENLTLEGLLRIYKNEKSKK